MKSTMQICRLFGVAVTLACAVVGCCRVPPPTTAEDVLSHFVACRIEAIAIGCYHVF